MAVNQNTIVTLVISVLMLVVLLNVASSVIPTGAIAFHNLTDNLAGGSEYLGTSASTFAGGMDDYIGWFWVIGPFILVLTIVVGVFLKKRR